MRVTPRVRGGEGKQMAKFQFVGIVQYLRTRTYFLKKQRRRSKIA